MCESTKGVACPRNQNQPVIRLDGGFFCARIPVFSRSIQFVGGMPARDVRDLRTKAAARAAFS